MKKMETYWMVGEYGVDAAFVANLIVTRHENATRKLKGLLKLLKAGVEVRMAQFSCDELIVGGSPTSWSYLETV